MLSELRRLSRSIQPARHNHLGTPRMLTNQVGELVWSTFQRPYGEVGEKTKTDPLSGRVVVTNLRLPGQYDERVFAQAGIGLQGPYYNWNRWYLPGVGRYLELDPLALAGYFNGSYTPDWYNYVENRPLTWSDPDGLSKTDNRFGYPDEFWDWYHRKVKEPGDPDLDAKSAEEWYEEWKKEGKPSGDKKGGRGGGRGGSGTGGGGAPPGWFPPGELSPMFFFDLCKIAPDVCKKLPIPKSRRADKCEGT